MTETQRGRVLVVESNRSVGASIRRALDKHQVLVLESGHEALARIVSEQFDVILYDLMLPGLSGMDFYDRLASIAPDMVEHVVFLTGGAFTPRARAFLDQGSIPRLEKPFALVDLREMVRAHVVRARKPR